MLTHQPASGLFAQADTAAAKCRAFLSRSPCGRILSMERPTTTVSLGCCGGYGTYWHTSSTSSCSALCATLTHATIATHRCIVSAVVSGAVPHALCVQFAWKAEPLSLTSLELLSFGWLHSQPVCRAGCGAAGAVRRRHHMRRAAPDHRHRPQPPGWLCQVRSEALRSTRAPHAGCKDCVAAL